MSQLLAAITPTESQRLDVSSKVISTRSLLNAAFPSSSTLPVNRTIMIGSADRGTIIRPVNDVDVMAQFTNKDSIFEQYRYDSAALLQRIRNALNAKTTVRHVGARGQAVRLFYRSGAHVDIAPVFKWSGSGYALPSGTGGWITTDPEAQATWYSGRKTTVGVNHLTPLVKIVKRWNAVHSHRCSSYHLEVMVASMFATVGANYRDALKCFFEWAPNYLAVSDPAGHYGPLDDYLTWTVRTEILSRLSGALVRAKSALIAEADGNHAEAKRLWQIELGADFPTT
jgi:SMODS domain-containing protein